MGHLVSQGREGEVHMQSDVEEALTLQHQNVLMVALQCIVVRRVQKTSASGSY